MRVRYFINIIGEQELSLAGGDSRFIPKQDDWIVELQFPLDFMALQVEIERRCKEKDIHRPELIMLQRLSLVHESIVPATLH